MKFSYKLFGLCLLFTIVISNFIKTGETLDNLRNNVLRMHILANSDTTQDQTLKLEVRDVLLEHSEEIFGKAENIQSAVEISSENLDKIQQIAQEVVSSSNMNYIVNVEETEMFFEERIYGDITMPEGVYNTIRVTIGEAKGKNWWCVMYPPLCIPMASEVTDDNSVEALFSEDEQDIMENPKKYEIRFMLWDKLVNIF